jgi:hypothetical protein
VNAVFDREVSDGFDNRPNLMLAANGLFLAVRIKNKENCLEIILVRDDFPPSVHVMTLRFPEAVGLIIFMSFKTDF